MGLIGRLGRIFNSEANAAVDSMENASKMSDQIIRELKENYQEAINGEASIKAILLGHRANEKKANDDADAWEKKANDLLDMIENKSIDEVTGNSLATKAAEQAQIERKKAGEFKTMADKEDAALSVMDTKITAIKNQIEEAENKAEMIKSRSQTADATSQINKTLSSVNTDGLMSTLDRMDKKVTAKEFQAQAYSEINDTTLTASQEIDKVLSQNNKTSALDAIKAKRAIKPQE